MDTFQRRRTKNSHNSTHTNKQNGRLTLNLHLVTTTNFKVWSFPKISSLHKMSSCQDREQCFREAGKDSVHQPPPPTTQHPFVLPVKRGGGCSVCRGTTDCQALFEILSPPPLPRTPPPPPPPPPPTHISSML